MRRSNSFVDFVSIDVIFIFVSSSHVGPHSAAKHNSIRGFALIFVLIYSWLTSAKTKS